jgi:hypothetical protein
VVVDMGTGEGRSWALWLKRSSGCKDISGIAVAALKSEGNYI